MVNNLNKKYFLALDTAFEQGLVCLFNSEGEILSEQKLPHKMSHGSLICQKIEACLNEGENPKLEAVFVGLGPGSFVGIRIALATALGFAFAKDLPLLGFCSHEAIAHSFSDLKNLSLIAKASGSLVYFSAFNEARHLIDKTQVIEKTKAAKLALTSQCSIISDVNLDPDLNESQYQLIVGPKAEGLVKLLKKQIDMGPLINQSTHIKPNYVKGPNISLKKPS